MANSNPIDPRQQYTAGMEKYFIQPALGFINEYILGLPALGDKGSLTNPNAVREVLQEAGAPESVLPPASQQSTSKPDETNKPNEVEIPKPEVKPTAPPQPIPTGRDRLDQSQIDLNKAVIDILRQSVDPETRRRNAEIDAEIQRQRDIFLARERQKGLQELTRRDTIQRWYALRQEQVRSNALMAMSLQNTAYIANTPNASVLSALQQPLQIAAQAVQQGKSVI